MVSCDGTVLLVSAVANKTAREGQDFFPLTVDYQEKFYAGGRIPGGFFKREGRQTEKETLISRLIDRPIRPLFPDGFRNEVQIIATVMSMNPEVDGDILALLGASAALSLSGAPFDGPIGAAKVGYKDGQYLLNPSKSELVDSQLELVVAGTANAVLMVESEAQELSEDVMLGAVMFGHQQMQVAIDTINALVTEAGKPKWTWSAPATSEGMLGALTSAIGDRLTQAFAVRDKLERKDAISALKKDVLASLAPQCETNGWKPAELSKEFGELEYQTMLCFLAYNFFFIEPRFTLYIGARHGVITVVLFLAAALLAGRLAAQLSMQVQALRVANDHAVSRQELGQRLSVAANEDDVVQAAHGGLRQCETPIVIAGVFPFSRRGRPPSPQPLSRRRERG